MRSTEATLLVLALCAFSGSAVAAQAGGSIRIQADSMRMDIESGTSRYLGNVILSNDDITLSGDSLVIEGRDSNRRIRVEGTPARFDQAGEEGMTRAESRSMVYEESSGILTLERDARLDRKQQLIESELIRYNTQSRTLLAGAREGSEQKSRVNIILDGSEARP